MSSYVGLLRHRSRPPSLTRNPRWKRVARDFGFEFPGAQMLAARASPKRIALIEDQFFVAAVVRIQTQLMDVFGSSHWQFSLFGFRSRLRVDSKCSSWLDTQLFHSRDQSRALQPHTGGSPVWTADAAVGVSESLNNRVLLLEHRFSATG